MLPFIEEIGIAVFNSTVEILKACLYWLLYFLAYDPYLAVGFLVATPLLLCGVFLWWKEKRASKSAVLIISLLLSGAGYSRDERYSEARSYAPSSYERLPDFRRVETKQSAIFNQKISRNWFVQLFYSIKERDIGLKFTFKPSVQELRQKSNVHVMGWTRMNSDAMRELKDAAKAGWKDGREARQEKSAYKKTSYVTETRPDLPDGAYRQFNRIERIETVDLEKGRRLYRSPPTKDSETANAPGRFFMLSESDVRKSIEGRSREHHFDRVIRVYKIEYPMTVYKGLSKESNVDLVYIPESIPLGRALRWDDTRKYEPRR